MRKFFAFLLGVPLFATTTITAIEPTATQAVIRVTTDQPGACTYRVAQGTTFSAIVNDVNTTLFPGSNSDARFGSIRSDDNTSHVFVVGTRASQAITMKGPDGNFYSRALQANTQHIAGVTCGADPEITRPFKTLNPSFGSPGPDWVFPMDTSGWGNEAWPTVFWNTLQTTLSQTDGSGKDQSIIDPLTGFLLKRVEGPGEAGWNYPNYPALANAPLSVGAATNWANPGNVILNSSASADCAGTCVTNQNPITIIAPIPAGYPAFAAGYQQTLQTFDDMQVRIQGCDDASGSADRVYQAAISLHPRLGEVNSNWINLPPLPRCSPTGTVNTVSSVAGPSNFPAAFFAGWTGGAGIRTSEIGQRAGATDCVGGACTLASGAPFNINWKNGDAITIAGSNPTCPSNVCLVASVQSSTKITLQQNLTIAAAQFTANAFAFLIRKATTTGTGHLNYVTYDVNISVQHYSNSSGGFRPFSSVPATTTFDRAGTNDGVPRTGYCMATITGGGGIFTYFFIPATGESRFLAFINIGGGFSPTWSSAQPCTWYIIDGANNLLKLSYTDTTYKETGYDAAKGVTACYNGGNQNVGCSGSSLVSTATVLSGSALIPQITAAYAAYGGTFNSTYFSTFGLSGSLGDTIMLTSSFAASQDMLAIRCYYSISRNQIVTCVDTWSKAPASFGVLHSGGNPAGTIVENNAGRERLGINPLGNGGYEFGFQPAAQVDVNCVVSRDPTCSVPVTGYCSSNSGSDSQGNCAGSWVNCPANNYGAPTDQAKCVHIKFNNQPAIKTPNSVNGQFLAAFPWCSAQSGRFGVWSFLKPLQPGDSLKNWTQGNPYMDWLLVLSVSGSSCDGVIDVWLWHDWNGWIEHGNADPPTFAGGPVNRLAPGTPLYGAQGCSGIWFQFSTGAAVCDPSSINSYHGDYSQNGTADAGTIITAGLGLYVRSGPNPETLKIFESYTNPGITFNGSQAASGSFQSHLSLGVADLNANPFMVDGKNLASSNGGIPVYGVTITGPISPYSSVYKVSMSGSLDRKNLPLYVRAGRFLLKDISGPGAAITDSTTNSYCVVEYGNACGLSGTNAGDVYINAPFLNTAATNCSGDLDLGGPCAFTNLPHGLHIFQQGTAFDPIGARYRRLSSLLGGIGHEFPFWNGIPTPDGSWVLALSQFVNGFTSVNFMIKVPPFPVDDHNNSRYVARRLDIGPGPGTQVRARFGYLENEPSGSSQIHYYATSRLETTNTCIPTARPGDPFAYASETSTCAAASSGVAIPAVPGRVLYYVIDRMDGSGNVVESHPPRVLAIP